ncbi:cadmium/zinc-transporting ATPase HMA3-like isoform X2 [Cicer arietinum]|uniref:cadmium/zinc-transporting ATPase HMA3-like isoform X2 n=1 Tax=Cicer arietinum TaxID=3827 RepID=UPI003CC5FF0B
MVDENMKRSNFEVLGMCCATEASLVERILKPLHGVKDVSVIVPTRTVTVVHDVLFISQSQIADALNNASLEASYRPHGESNNIEKKWPDFPTMACGLLLVLSFLKYLYPSLEWLALGSVAIGFPKVLFRAIASIKALTLNINILVVFADGGVIIFLFSIAQWLETRATHKAMVAMSSLTNMAPQMAIAAETGERVDVNEVKINTILAVKAGEAIPLDGVVVDGKCEVDEKMLTGESFPVTKESDSLVWAGTINMNGYISVRTIVLAKDTVVAKMSRLVEEASSRKSQAQRFIDNFAKYYIPVVVLISASIAVVPAAISVPDIEPWFHLSLVVLLSGCPCALILSTPVAIFCALTKAAISGLLLKGGDYLETLSRIKTVAFDKTGTITRGEFSVTDFSGTDDIDNETILYWISSIESKSSHPVAAALVEYGMLHSIKPVPENVENFQNFPGEGIFGTIDGRDIYIGNRRIGIRAQSERVDCQLQFQSNEISAKKQYCGQTLVGVFSLVDACRSGALEAIEELKLLGVRSVMLTGDSSQVAMYVQSQLNHAIDIVHAELLPHEKATIIENLKKQGPTAMIGDGINDAPALATADIGISMGISGSALANETSNAILMSNDIRKVPEAIRLARKTTRKLIENVIISVGFKCAILALAIAGYPLVWLAVLTDVGTCLFVILNSMLILQENKKDESESSTRSNKYGNFLEVNVDVRKGLLSDEKCGKGCCKNVTDHVETTKARKIESCGNDHGSYMFVEVHVGKPCNDLCLEKVKMCDEGKMDKSIDDLELSETSGIDECCKNKCCNEFVDVDVDVISSLGGKTEIIIE